MYNEIIHNLLLNISRGYKSLSQGMVGGFAWGLSSPILNGKEIAYSAKDVANTLLLANLVGIGGYAVGDATEYLAHKMFPLPKVGLNKIKDAIKKHPIVTIATISALGITAIDIQNKLRKPKSNLDKNQPNSSSYKGNLWYL